MIVPAWIRQAPADVESALETVFARPEFQPPQTSPLWQWLADRWNDLVAFLIDLLPSIAFDSGSRTVIFWIVATALVIAATASALHVARHLPRRGVRPGRPNGPDPVGAGAVRVETAAAWDALAVSLADQARWREASLALYQALLLRLQARGVVHVDPAKTPGDYRRESRPHPESRHLLHTFLRDFEPIAFGPERGDATSFVRLRSAAFGAGSGDE